MNRICRFSVCFILVGAMLLFVGCGRPGVSGKVTLNGEPISAGLITFEPVDGADDGEAKKLKAEIFRGKYQIHAEQIAAGEYKVKVKVHFVTDEEAKEFYQHFSDHLNKKKIMNGTVPEPVNPEPPKKESEGPKPKVDFDFSEKLSGGSDVRNFDLKR